MGRTQLSPQRLSETKKTNIGRIIIFCEGKTEKYYFDYFAEIIKKNKYTDVEVILENTFSLSSILLFQSTCIINSFFYIAVLNYYG